MDGFLLCKPARLWRIGVVWCGSVDSYVIRFFYSLFSFLIWLFRFRTPPRDERKGEGASGWLTTFSIYGFQTTMVNWVDYSLKFYPQTFICKKLSNKYTKKIEIKLNRFCGFQNNFNQTWNSINKFMSNKRRKTDDDITYNYYW